jgi:hypothetical protein
MVSARFVFRAPKNIKAQLRRADGAFDKSPGKRNRLGP